MLVKKTIKLENIDPRTWEHPADRAALTMLKQLKGLDELVKILVSVTTERSLKLMVLSSAVKVSQNQYPALHHVLNEVVDTFNWDYTPPMFVTKSPFWNAGVMGVKEPFIIINSSMINHLEENELTAIIAHEMGHIMSGHALYKTLIFLLTKVSLSVIPMASLVLTPVILALNEWDRKSELSADRAGLLAAQDTTPSFNLLMKMAGAEDLTQVNLTSFFEQAREYEDQKSVLDGIHKLLNQIWLSHPFPVIRLQELHEWEASGHFKAILDGNYLKRGDQGDLRDDIKAGYDYYTENVHIFDNKLSDITTGVSEGIGKVMEGIGKAAGDIGDTIGDTIKDIFDKNENK